MIRDLPSDYRPYILNYFKEKDRMIYSILEEEKHDLRFPFKTAYYLYNLKEEKVDVVAFLSACKIFNKNKNPIRDKSSYGLPKRGDIFLERIIEDRIVAKEMAKFTTSVFVANQMLEKVTKDPNFRWVIYKPIVTQFNEILYSYDLNYIIVDTANVHKKIQEYNGRNASLIRFKEDIIKRRSLSQCIDDLISYMVNRLNGDYHKLIFMAPCKYVTSKSFDDTWYIFPIDCLEYVGQKCYENDLYGEVDDSLTMMVYDYCSYHYGAKVSLMSADNFDYSSLTQDYSAPIKRSVFSNENPSVILSWEDILLEENSDFKFGPDNRVTIFQEEFYRDR